MRNFIYFLSTLALVGGSFFQGVANSLNPPDYLPPPTKAERWEAQERRIIQEIENDLQKLLDLEDDVRRSLQDLERQEKAWQVQEKMWELEDMLPPRPLTPEEKKENLRELDKLWEQTPASKKEEKKPERHRPLRRGEKIA